jgi:hypothetical protein
MEPSAEHQLYVAQFLAKHPHWKRHGMMQELKKASHLFNDFGKASFIPDAFYVNKNSRTLSLLEIEMHSRLTPYKMTNLASFWWALDCGDWFMDLQIYNGVNKTSRFLSDKDFCQLYYYFECKERGDLQNLERYRLDFI